MKPSSIHRTIKHVLSTNIVPFIWGAPGVGKSAVVAQVADELGYELRDIRLSLMDPVDLRGFPVPDTTKKQMKWLPAEWLPTKGKGVLFLDELNSSPPATQAAAYQLILNRQIGEYKLPAGWKIIAAGNRDSDRSVVHRMPAALANRMVHLDFDVHLDDFTNWAAANGVIPEVRAFLRFKSNLLHSFDTSSNPRAFPSPRSWAFVSQLAKSQLPADEELELIKGAIGEGPAAEFVAYMRIWRDLPSVDAIMLNPDKVPVPEAPNVLYALTTSLADKAGRDNFDRLMKYVGRIPTEFQVVFVRDTARRCDDIDKTKAFVDWSVKHSDVLL
jgi:hypothetical protein